MEIAVAFNDGDFGRVESMTLYQMGREFECPRTADATQGDLPTLEEVFELARLDERQEALARAGLIHLAGRARFINSGLDADYTLTFDAQDRFRSDIEMEKFGSIRVAVTPDSGAIDVSFSPFEELEGKWLEQTRGEHPRSFLGDWRDLYDEIRVVSVGETDGRETVAVRVKRGDLPASTLHLDRETGDVVRIDSRQEVPGMEGVSLPVKTTLRRWTEINGLRIPFEMEVETQQNGRLMIITERLETGGDMNAAYFILTRNEEGAGG